MVHRGEWRRPYRAVFVDNSAPITPMQAVVAASFAVGGLASHRLCLWLWDLRPDAAPEATEFSVAQGQSGRVPGVKIYRLREMPTAFRRGIVPVTSPMRGLLDTAGVAPNVVPVATGDCAYCPPARFRSSAAVKLRLSGGRLTFEPLVWL